MTDRAIIVDRAYQPYEGERRSTSWIMWAIVVDGFRKVFGIRRKFTRKLLPWGVVGMMSMILAGVVIPAWFIGDQLGDLPLPENAEYFDIISLLPELFIALAAPALLVPDRRQGTLAIYLSRPINRAQYLLAKVGALFVLMMFVWLAPQAILFTSLASLDGGGFFAYFADNADVLLAILGTALVYFTLHASLGLFFAATVPRSGFAAGSYLGTLLIANLLTSSIVENDMGGERWLGLFALEQHPRVIRDWFFDVQTQDYIPTVAGFEPWVSLATVGAIAAISAIAIWVQYRRLP